MAAVCGAADVDRLRFRDAPPGGGVAADWKKMVHRCVSMEGQDMSDLGRAEERHGAVEATDDSLAPTLVPLD